jgi:hypothetical protein
MEDAMNTAKVLAQDGRSLTFTRVDTESLVGAVLFGLVFVLVQQVAHRIDAVINPACVIVGGVTWATMTALVALLYRQPAGFITGEVAALVALATGLSPLALFFIPANGLGSLAFSLVVRNCTNITWSRILLAQIAANVVGNVCVAVGLRTILNLPYPVIGIAAAITCLAGIIGGTILTKLIYGNLVRSGLTR